ncbi:MAG: universal stress protein [Dehalococcoidia bacterium]
MVTSDGSWRSLQALPHAARLADATGGELVIARVLDPAADCRAEGEDVSPEAAERLAARWRTDMERTLSGFHFRGRAAVGMRLDREEVTDTVLRMAAEEGANALAMSSRGAGMLRHAFLGSVALDVLAHSELPVLVAGDRIAYPDTRAAYHLLVATDGSPDSLHAVRLAASIAKAPGVRVTLVRVYAPTLGDRGIEAETAAALDDLETLCRSFPNPGAVQCLVPRVVVLGGIDTAILNVAHQVGAHAIALSTHGHSARYHVFAGSTALAMLKRSPLPVMLVGTNPERGTTAL